MAEIDRAKQKMSDAAEALRARQADHEKACGRGRQPQIKRTRAALVAAQAAYEAANRDVERLDGAAEEVVQAQLRAAYM